VNVTKFTDTSFIKKFSSDFFGEDVSLLTSYTNCGDEEKI